MNLTKISQRLFAVFLAAGSLVCSGHARADDGSAGGAAPYLRDGVGARGLGMGNAQAAASSDATSAYWNPAALIRLDGSCLASQTAVLGDDRRWDFVNFAQRGTGESKTQYAYGISWINFSAGHDLEARTSNRPDPDSIFGDEENTIFLSAAAEAEGSQTSLGANVKFLNHSLGDDSATGFGMDFALWHDYGMFKGGLMCQDLYSTLNWASSGHVDRLPTLWRLGVEAEVLPGVLRASADGTMEYSHEGVDIAQWAYHVGLEYQPREWVAVRVGLDYNRLTAGLGFKLNLGSWGWARLDYALAGEQLPGAGLTHLFSLILDMPAGKGPG